MPEVFMTTKRTGICVLCAVLSATCLLTSCKQITSDGSGVTIDMEGPQSPGGDGFAPNGSPDQDMDTIGDWEVPEEIAATEEDRLIFDSAVAEHPDKKYELLASVATRSNKGLDHCYLCRTQGTYKLVCVNESYQDAITYTGDSDLEWPGKGSSDAPGSWSAAESTSVTDGIISVIDKVNGSAEELYTPVIYLGSQTVNGTNHAVICLAEPRDPVSPAINYKLRLVNVYEGADGSVSINEIKDLDMNLYFPAT